MQGILCILCTSALARKRQHLHDSDSTVYIVHTAYTAMVLMMVSLMPLLLLLSLLVVLVLLLLLLLLLLLFLLLLLLVLLFLLLLLLLFLLLLFGVTTCRGVKKGGRRTTWNGRFTLRPFSISVGDCANHLCFTMQSESAVRNHHYFQSYLILCHIRCLSFL